MRLSTDALSCLPDGIAAPAYDRARLSPGIVHIGVGNFHRAHMAVYMGELFALGLDHDWAIVGAGVRAADAAMRDRLAAQDWLATAVELAPGGTRAQIVGAMIDFVPVMPDNAALIDRMARPDIRIVSLTVTEGGYYVDPATGAFDPSHPDIAADAANPAAPATAFGAIVAALARRRSAGIGPFTAQSCDNLPGNGDVLRAAVTGLARLSDPSLADWIEAGCTFPNSMVDRIVPATGPRELDMLRDRFGIEDAAPVTHEPFRQWVIEDRFCAGRPQWEKVGATFTDHVHDYERMKIRILNGGHAAICYPAGLLGHVLVSDAMADARILAFFRKVEQQEMAPMCSRCPA